MVLLQNDEVKIKLEVQDRTESEADLKASLEDHPADTEDARDEATTADTNENDLQLHPAAAEVERHKASTADDHHLNQAATAGASTHPRVRNKILL